MGRLPKSVLIASGFLLAQGWWMVANAKHDFPTSDINPRVAPEDREAGRFVASRIVIDACRPYRWLKEFPATNVMSPDKKKQIAAKWRSVLDKLGR